MSGKMVSLTNRADSPRTLHQGRPINELAHKILSLMVSISGSRGVKIHGILDRYYVSKLINLS
jgi:hypothetical protein